MLNNNKDVNYVNEFLNGNYNFHNIDIELMIPQKYEKEEVMKLSIEQLNEGITLMKDVLKNFEDGKFAMFIHADGKTVFIDYVDKKMLNVPMGYAFIDDNGVHKVFNYGFDKTGAENILSILKAHKVGKIIDQQCRIMEEQIEAINNKA